MWEVPTSVAAERQVPDLEGGWRSDRRLCERLSVCAGDRFELREFASKINSHPGSRVTGGTSLRDCCGDDGGLLASDVVRQRQGGDLFLLFILISVTQLCVPHVKLLMAKGAAADLSFTCLANATTMADV